VAASRRGQILCAAERQPATNRNRVQSTALSARPLPRSGASHSNARRALEFSKRHKILRRADSSSGSQGQTASAAQFCFCSALLSTRTPRRGSNENEFK
jgi:hypothetical protein